MRANTIDMIALYRVFILVEVYYATHEDAREKFFWRRAVYRREEFEIPCQLAYWSVIPLIVEHQILIIDSTRVLVTNISV